MRRTGGYFPTAKGRTGRIRPISSPSRHFVPQNGSMIWALISRPIYATLKSGQSPQFIKQNIKQKEKTMEKTTTRPASIYETEYRCEFEKKLLAAGLTKSEIFLLLLKIKQISDNKV